MVGINPKLGGLFGGWFSGGVGSKITPCLKLVKTMLETSISITKYKHICSFRKYPF